MPQPSGIARSTRPERRYRRFQLRYPVHLLFRSDQLNSEADAVTRNVSIGGLLLECPVSSSKHTAVSFIIRMGGSTAHPFVLVGEGEVVRVKIGDNGSKFLIAVECTAPITQLEDFLQTAPN